MVMLLPGDSPCVARRLHHWGIWVQDPSLWELEGSKPILWSLCYRMTVVVLHSDGLV
jgi:hypothetical protein